MEVSSSARGTGGCRAGSNDTSRANTSGAATCPDLLEGERRQEVGGTLSWIWGSVPLRGSLSHPMALTHPPELTA